jgi:hypothetical protein
MVNMVESSRTAEWAKYAASVGEGDPAGRIGLPINTYALQFLLGHVGFIVFGTSRPDLIPPIEPVVTQDGCGVISI